MKGVAYKAVLLCLLVALNEFGPAHFMRIESRVARLSKKSDKSFREEGDEENEDYDDDTRYDAEKRSLGSTLFKVVKFGSEFFPKVTSLASMISTIYLLIEQCCGGKWKNVCVWNDEVESIRKELDTKGKEIEKMELETKNLQDSLIAAKQDFSDIVMKMNDIGKASGHLLKQLDPEMEIALNKTSNEMALLIKEKKAAGEKATYVEIETEFFGAMDGILGVAVPVFTTIIPSVPKLVKWAKARMGRYKVYELDHSVDAKAIEPPDINDAKYQSSKSWFGKQVKQITYQVDMADYQLKTKYKKAYNVFKTVKEYFGVVTGYASTAFSIYMVVKKFKKCDTAYEEAEKAVKEMRKAKTKMNEIYDAVVASRQHMYEARDSLKVNLTEGVFINDLKELKTSLDNIKQQGVDQNFLNVLDAIGNYVTESPNSKESTFTDTERLMRMLYENLYQLPKYYECYSDKVSVISTVLRRCKEGDDTLSNLNKQAKAAKDFDWKSCQTKIGMDPITDEQLEELVENEAAKDKSFNKVCELNSADRKETVCYRKCSPSFDEDETANILGVSVDVVKILLKGCKLCDSVVDMVCYLRSLSEEATDEKIQQRSFPQYTLEEIKGIKCP